MSRIGCASGDWYFCPLMTDISDTRKKTKIICIYETRMSRVSFLIEPRGHLLLSRLTAPPKWQ